jgi:hypothetical protein
MVNAWIEHVRDYAARNGKTYGCAISDPECKASYVKVAKPKASRKARTPKQPKEPKPRTPRKPKSIQEKLQERIQQNRMNLNPLTDNQLMFKERLQERIQKNRMNSKPSQPSPKPSQPSPKPSVGGGGVKKSSGKIGERESDKTNRIFVKFFQRDQGILVSFYGKYGKQKQWNIFTKIIGDKKSTKKDFSRTQLIQIFKEWYDEEKSKGKEFFRFQNVPFNDLIFEF